MRTVGIISEYNPFHNGHKRQIDLLREKDGDCTVVSIMSPNFVQRGELSLFDKYSRAEAALLGGVDVCVSMPFVFANLSAEGFADAGVRIADLLKLDALSFGVECDEPEILFEIADLMLSSEFKDELEKVCRTYPQLSLMRAGEAVVEKYFGKNYADAVSCPNNILALEYIKAAKKHSSSLELMPVKREGEGYKSMNDSSLPSAMMLREKIAQGLTTHSFVPDSCTRLYEKLIGDGDYADYSAFTSVLHAMLILKSEGCIKRCVGNVELASRIINNLQEARDLEELILHTVGTRVTRSRVKRALISCLFDIAHNEFMHDSPAYVQLLGASSTGREFLATRRKGDFPIIVKNANTSSFSDYCGFKKQWELEKQADAIWSRCRKAPLPSNTFIKKSPHIL